MNNNYTSQQPLPSIDKPPTARIVAVDFSRGLAVLFMILVHTLWMYADQQTQSQSLLGDVIHFIGKGTPSFLLCMGLSMTLSRQQSAVASFKRGCMILLFGYMMNALKFIVPIAAGVMPEAFLDAYGFSYPMRIDQYRYLLLTGDILQMAGLSLLLLAVIRHFISNKYLLLTLAFITLLIAKPFSGWQPNIVGIDYLFELLFSNNFHVYFPVFPWLSFIIFGLFIGQLLQESDDIEQIFSRLPVVAAICLIIGGGLCYYDFTYHFGNFFHLGPGGVIYLLGINLLLFWFIHRLVILKPELAIFNLLAYCSQRVTSLYVIQWTVVCWGMAVVGFQQFNTLQTLMAMPVVMAITFAVQFGKDRLAESLTAKNTMANAMG